MCIYFDMLLLLCLDDFFGFNHTPRKTVENPTDKTQWKYMPLLQCVGVRLCVRINMDKNLSSANPNEFIAFCNFQAAKECQAKIRHFSFSLSPFSFHKVCAFEREVFPLHLLLKDTK